MAVINSLYTRYTFDDSELNQVYTFSDLNLQHIQNELAIVAEEKANLIPEKDEPNNERSLTLRLMYLQGKMDALAALIATDRDTRYAIQQELQQELDSKQANNDQQRS